MPKCYTLRMKIQHLAAAALFTAPLCPATEAAPVTVSDDLQPVLNDYVRVMKSICELIEGIHDKESANAAMPKLSSRIRLMQELLFGIHYLPEEVTVQALAEAGVTEDRLEKSNQQLIQNRFYGSVELARVLGFPAMAALEPGEVTPELLQTVGAELMAALQGKLGNIGGGPGLTEQTAWKLGKDEENLEYIRTVMSALPDAEKEDQTLVRTEEGPIYGRMTYLLPRDGKVYRMQMWFEITDIILAQEAEEAAAQAQAEEEEEMPVRVIHDLETVQENEPEELPEPQYMPLPESSVRLYTAEEKAAAVKQFVQLFKESVEVANSITDRASADAAALKIDNIGKKAEQIQVDRTQISEMDILEEMERNNIDMFIMQKHIERIREANFYGSEALKRAMMNN